MSTYSTSTVKAYLKYVTTDVTEAKLAFYHTVWILCLHQLVKPTVCVHVVGTWICVSLCPVR